MFSRFVRLFKNTDQDELRALQTRVVRFLNETYPDKEVGRGNDPLQVVLDGAVCGLTNIHSAYLLSSQTETEFQQIVGGHFRILLASGNLSETPARDWPSAESKLMPQLMPREFLQKIPIVHSEFCDNVVLAYVIDSDQAYSYVSLDDLDRWKIDETELADVAQKNLADRSRGLEVNAIEPPNGFIVFSTMDGFDAVRIVSPGVREFVGGIIGTPFRFGAPNRDFLICWELNDDQEFQSRLTGQVAQDFSERPYPLSPLVFEVDSKGQIKPLTPQSPSPMAAAAENN